MFRRCKKLLEDPQGERDLILCSFFACLRSLTDGWEEPKFNHEDKEEGWGMVSEA